MGGREREKRLGEGGIVSLIEETLFGTVDKVANSNRGPATSVPPVLAEALVKANLLEMCGIQERMEAREYENHIQKQGIHGPSGVRGS